MPDTPNLNRPWLVAVWPGMGHVALNAGGTIGASGDQLTLAASTLTFIWNSPSWAPFPEMTLIQAAHAHR